MKKTPTLPPSLSPAIPIDIRRSLQRLEQQTNLLHSRLDDQGDMLKGKLGSSTNDLLALAESLRAHLQAAGASPLNIAGLTGVAAQGQKAVAPTVTYLPPSAANGTLVVQNGVMYRYENGSWVPIGGSTGGGTDGGGGTGTGAAILIGTHDARSFLSLPDLADGTLYWELDRLVFYIVSGGIWTFAAGTMCDLVANRPADLGSVDAGFMFFATDAGTLSEWSGSIWITLSGGGALQGETPSGTLDGVNKVFTVVHTPFELFLNGVLQDPAHDYTPSGTTITYRIAPWSDDTHIAMHT